jgi:predicted Zn finger-like uncharacterized protein
MSAMRTRCNRCGMGFRVSEEQLAMADGLVRCGACNAVFDARSERLAEPGEADASPNPPRKVTEDYIAELLTETVGQPGTSGEPVAQTAQAPEDSATKAPVIARLPVEIAAGTPQDPARRRRQLVWLASALALLLVLVPGYAWLTRERHAQDPAMRGWYEKACALLGCVLPAYSDPRRIRSDGLVVRADPEEERQLTMDAMLVNTAAFAQRFPSLELRFSDNQGRVILTRVFQPHEYLGGAALREGLMPPGEQIRVHARFEDPGEEATGYELRLNPARD